MSVLGLSIRVKGYRLYDVESKQIFLSRDVIFHEDIFPFHTVRTTDQILDSFLDLVLSIPSMSFNHESSISENPHSPSPPHQDSSSSHKSSLPNAPSRSQ